MATKHREPSTAEIRADKLAENLVSALRAAYERIPKHMLDSPDAKEGFEQFALCLTLEASKRGITIADKAEYDALVRSIAKPSPTAFRRQYQCRVHGVITGPLCGDCAQQGVSPSANVTNRVD